jgi:hypothetical protein
VIKITIKDFKEACPPATQDTEKNLKNRQHAIDEYGYGPPNPEEENEEFWAKKAEMWKVDPKEVKTMRCGNCSAFNKSPKMLKCIEKGLKANQESEADSYEEVIDQADLGYCEMYKFKCAAKRTCDSWVTGGPITK